MDKAKIIRPLLSIFFLSLVVRTLTALPQRHPRTMDEAYSFINAVTLAEGRGFTEDFIWNYLNPPQTITHPGNLYWMPLSSLIAWVGLKLGGISYDTAQWGFIFLSALLPPLGYLIAWRVSGQVRHAWVVALMVLWSGFYFPMWTTIDNFTPFALAGAISLVATWQAVETSDGRWALLAGLMAGLGHLARADGPLLLITIGLALLGYTLLPAKTLSTRLNFVTAIKLFTWLAVGYLIVMFPWFLRNIKTIGAPLASGGTKTIWLRSYNDLFSYEQDLSWQSYLAWGWGPILQSKLWALGQNLQHILGEPGMIFALPLAIVGWWQQRKHPLFQIAFLYLSLLFIIMTFVFTFPGPRGAIFHSGGVLLPFMLTAAVVGLDSTVETIARRRRVWRAKSAKMVFSSGLVILALFLTILIYIPGLRQDGNPDDTAYPSIAAYLADQKAIVMIGNPPAFLYHGGYKAIIIPNEPIETALYIADRYGATYLALDKHYPAPLKPYFTDQQPHPRLRLEATFGGPTYLYRILP
jgi:hypothetical protein